MKRLILAIGGGAAALGVVLALTGVATAGADKVAFPADMGKLYGSVDRADLKQYRELFATPAAIEAAKAGKPMPSGTVLTMVNYKAKVDAKGELVKDASGRLVKDALAGYVVMEKRTGWGGQYPNELRNGEWEYQAFTPAKAVNDKANIKACFECHKPKEAQDFVFSIDKLKTVR